MVLDRNQVYCACETGQAAHKLILHTRQQGLRAYCPNIYTVSIEEVECGSQVRNKNVVVILR